LGAACAESAHRIAAHTASPIFFLYFVPTLTNLPTLWKSVMTGV
jgi:hypothetical protein